MRILYHHRTLGDGAEGIHVAAMVKAFASHGHDVCVASVIGEQANVTTRRTTMLGLLKRWTPLTVYESLELGYSMIGYVVLLRQISEWRPDFVYERYSLFNLAGVRAARKTGIPLVLEVNAPLAYERARYEHLRLRRLAQRCEDLLCSRAELVVVVSTPLKDYLIERGVSAERIMVLPNAVDPDVFKPDLEARREIRRRLRIPDGAVVLGFVGILRPWHGLDLLLEALSQIDAEKNGVHLVVVGDGPELARIRETAGSLDLDRVLTLTGRVRHEEIPRYMAAFDIGVSPRATFYASPMKIPEYMAAGLAVVAPLMPNVEDLIAHGETGVLFEPENDEDLAATLVSLVQDDRRRDRIGAHARQDIVAGRTWRANAAKVLAYVSKVLK